MSTNHFQLCPKTVDKVIPSSVAAEEDEDDIEDKDKEAKEHLKGGKDDKQPEQLPSADAKEVVLAPGVARIGGQESRSRPSKIGIREEKSG